MGSAFVMETFLSHFRAAFLWIYFMGRSNTTIFLFCYFPGVVNTDRLVWNFCWLVVVLLLHFVSSRALCQITGEGIPNCLKDFREMGCFVELHSSIFLGHGKATKSFGHWRSHMLVLLPLFFKSSDVNSDDTSLLPL